MRTRGRAPSGKGILEEERNKKKKISIRTDPRKATKPPASQKPSTGFTDKVVCATMPCLDSVAVGRCEDGKTTRGCEGPTMFRDPLFAGHCWPRPWAGWRYLPHSSSRPAIGLILALSSKALSALSLSVSLPLPPPLGLSSDPPSVSLCFGPCYGGVAGPGCRYSGRG